MGSPPQALVLLQLWAHLDVLLVPSWQELSQHVCTFTKAFAQHPFKCVTPAPTGGCGWEGDRDTCRGGSSLVPLRAERAGGFVELDGMLEGHETSRNFPESLPAFRQYRESCAFSFCMDGRWAAGEQVARDGTGLRGVWWRQIKQFNRVSPAVANAVVAAFPSPCLLQQVGPLHPPGVEPGVQDPPLLIPVPALGIHGLQHGAGAPGPPGGPPREGGRGVWPRRGWGLTSPVASTSS